MMSKDIKGVDMTLNEKRELILKLNGVTDRTRLPTATLDMLALIADTLVDVLQEIKSGQPSFSLTIPNSELSSYPLGGEVLIGNKYIGEVTERTKIDDYMYKIAGDMKDGIKEAPAEIKNVEVVDADADAWQAHTVSMICEFCNKDISANDLYHMSYTVRAEGFAIMGHKACLESRFNSIKTTQKCMEYIAQVRR